jgi:hypothetical protein
MAYATRRAYAGAAPACTLTNNIASGDTSLSLTGDTTNWPSTATGPFFMVIDPGLANEEKILVTTRSTGSLSSVTRGVDGTIASAHNAGATCYPVFTAIDADQANKVASTLTTKGDLLVTDGSALNRLAAGTNDYLLVADSGQTNGVKWAQVNASGIASDAVTTAKILDANVTEAKLAPNAVATAKIADNAVTQAKLADRVVGSAEYNNLTLNAQTGTTYTLVLADAHKVVTLNNASPIALTVPTNASVAFSVGDQISLVQIGAGQVTVAGAGGVTVNSTPGLKLRTQWSGATLLKTAENSWVLFGDLSA